MSKESVIKSIGRLSTNQQPYQKMHISVECQLAYRQQPRRPTHILNTRHALNQWKWPNVCQLLDQILVNWQPILDRLLTDTFNTQPDSTYIHMYDPRSRVVLFVPYLRHPWDKSPNSWMLSPWSPGVRPSTVPSITHKSSDTYKWK